MERPTAIVCGSRRRRSYQGLSVRRRKSRLNLLAPLLVGLATSSDAQVEQLRVLVPLYARPEDDFWQHMVDSAQASPVSYSVVINPNNGPGNATEEAYTTGINNLNNAGVEVLCYVATGFGATNVAEVTADVDAYESFYPGLCGGYFFDEAPGAEENTWKYTEYYSHVQEAGGPGSTVVVNPGTRPHESLYHIGDLYAAGNPGRGGQVVVVSFENKYEVFSGDSENDDDQELPFPPRHFQDRYMHSILVYGAFFATTEEFLDWTVLQLYCANWGYVFFTDDAFGDDKNPWDEMPTYFEALLSAAGKAPATSVGACGTWAPTVAPIAPPKAVPTAPTPMPTPQQMVAPTVAPVPATEREDSSGATNFRGGAIISTGALAAAAAAAAAAAFCPGL